MKRDGYQPTDKSTTAPPNKGSNVVSAERICGNCREGSGVMREVTDLTQFLAENETESTHEFERKLDEEFELADRYEHLAEVARDMLRLLKNIEREYPRLLDPNRRPGGQIVYPMLSDEYANQLEELGVEL